MADGSLGRIGPWPDDNEGLPVRRPGASPEHPPTSIGNDWQAEAAAAQARVQPQPQIRAVPPPPPAPTGLSEMQITALANEACAALDEYDASGGREVTAEIAAEARTLISEFTALRSRTPQSSQELTNVAWTRVVEARKAYRSLLDGRDASPSASSSNVAAVHITEAQALKLEMEQAEAKARRPMSGPGAFKKFATARRQLETYLAEFGVTSFEELESMTQHLAVAEGPRTLQEAAEAVARAEAMWMEFERAGESTALPSTPESDGLRVRAYRLIGVVDDSEIERSLHVLAAGPSSPQAALDRMRFALQALGIPADIDPVGNARALQREVRGQR
jgi:hypothetical protein